MYLKAEGVGCVLALWSPNHYGRHSEECLISIPWKCMAAGCTVPTHTTGIAKMKQGLYQTNKKLCQSVINLF